MAKRGGEENGKSMDEGQAESRDAGADKQGGGLGAKSEAVITMHEKLINILAELKLASRKLGRNRRRVIEREARQAARVRRKGSKRATFSQNVSRNAARIWRWLRPWKNRRDRA